MGGFNYIEFAPKGDSLAFGFNRIKGDEVAPGLEPKHKKEPGFALKTVVLTLKNQSAIRATPCGRAPSFGFFSGGKVNLPPAVGESPRRLAEEVHSPFR